MSALVLSAYEIVVNGAVRWIVWCKHCLIWHNHRPAEGHRGLTARTAAVRIGGRATTWRLLGNGRIKNHRR